AVASGIKTQPWRASENQVGATSLLIPLATARGPVPFALQKQIGPLIAQEAACYITKKKTRISDCRFELQILNLLFIRDQQTALIQILTTQTVSGPGHGFQPFFLDGFAA